MAIGDHRRRGEGLGTDTVNAIVHIVAGEAYLRLKDNAKAREQFNLYLQEAPNGDQAEQARAALKSLDAAQ